MINCQLKKSCKIIVSIKELTRRYENDKLKYHKNITEAINPNKEELKWLLKGYEIRTKSKLKPLKQKTVFKQHIKNVRIISF